MIGGGLARTLVRKAVAAAVAAGAALVAVIAFGATVFYALCLVVPELAAAAITFLLFALAALAVTVIFLRRDAAEGEELEEEPLGLGTVAALAGGWIFLRNPALASIVAAAFTEKTHGRRGR